MKNFLQVLVLGIFLSGCKNANTVPDSSAKITPHEKPIIEYWDAGIYLAGVEPYPLLVVWRDGTVVKRVDGQTLIGSIPANSLPAILNRIQEAGYIQHTFGVVFQTVRNGVWPSRTAGVAGFSPITSGDDFNHFEEIGPQASPSREESEAFVATWKRTIAILQEIHPADLEPFREERKLEFPENAKESTSLETESIKPVTRLPKDQSVWVDCA